MTQQSRIGRNFTRLTVLERISPPGSKNPEYLCECVCGNKKAVRWKNLVALSTKSCGCLAKETLTAMIQIGRDNEALKATQRAEAKRIRLENKPPSKTRHQLYSAWCTMIRRCHDPKHTKYRMYGAKGVSVCDEWRSDFWAFVRDVGERPEGCTLDRVDPKGDYRKENCRWADVITQASNTRIRRVVVVVDFGKGQITLAAACKMFKVKYDKVKKSVTNGTDPHLAVVTAWFRRKRYEETLGLGGYAECEGLARKFLAGKNIRV